MADNIDKFWKKGMNTEPRNMSNISASLGDENKLKPVRTNAARATVDRAEWRPNILRAMPLGDRLFGESKSSSEYLKDSKNPKKMKEVRKTYK